MSGQATCATCQSIGVAYWDDGFRVSHHCMKHAIRREEGMPKGADFLAHFRVSFDASANQRACKHYAERPISPPDVLSLLERMAETGRVEVAFFSEESLVANRVSEKFVRLDTYAKAQKGYRVFRLLEVGKHEHARAVLAKAEGQL